MKEFMKKVMATLTVLIKEKMYPVLFLPGDCFWILCTKWKKNIFLTLGFIVVYTITNYIKVKS